MYVHILQRFCSIRLYYLSNGPNFSCLFSNFLPYSPILPLQPLILLFLSPHLSITTYFISLFQMMHMWPWSLHLYLTSGFKDVTWLSLIKQLISTYKQMYNILSFWVWVMSLSMIFSSSIHLLVNFMLLPIFNFWVIIHCVNIPYFSFILLLRSIYIVSKY